MNVQIPEDLQHCVDALMRREDARVVLWLDETMQHGENWLPTLNIEGDSGFYRLPEDYRSGVARFFGPDFKAAKVLVNQINAQWGVGVEDARGIVIEIMNKSRTW